MLSVQLIRPDSFYVVFYRLLSFLQRDAILVCAYFEPSAQCPVCRQLVFLARRLNLPRNKCPHARLVTQILHRLRSV